MDTGIRQLVQLVQRVPTAPLTSGFALRSAARTSCRRGKGRRSPRTRLPTRVSDLASRGGRHHGEACAYRIFVSEDREWLEQWVSGSELPRFAHVVRNSGVTGF